MKFYRYFIPEFISVNMSLSCVLQVPTDVHPCHMKGISTPDSIPYIDISWSVSFFFVHGSVTSLLPIVNTCTLPSCMNQTFKVRERSTSTQISKNHRLFVSIATFHCPLPKPSLFQSVTLLFSLYFHGYCSFKLVTWLPLHPLAAPFLDEIRRSLPVYSAHLKNIKV